MSFRLLVLGFAFVVASCATTTGGLIRTAAEFPNRDVVEKLVGKTACVEIVETLDLNLGGRKSVFTDVYCSPIREIRLHSVGEFNKKDVYVVISTPPPFSEGADETSSVTWAGPTPADGGWMVISNLKPDPEKHMTGGTRFRYINKLSIR